MSQEQSANLESNETLENTSTLSDVESPPYSYKDMVDKIVMWRKALEDGYHINTVFDSICVYLGEQQREIQNLRCLLKNKS